MVLMSECTTVNSRILDLRNSFFPFLNRELFDLRKIYVLNLKTGHPNWETHPQRLILMFQLGDIIITISKQLIGKGQIANE